MGYNLIVLIFIISFSKGILELIGIQDTMIQLGIEFLILFTILLGLSNILRNSKLIIPALISMIFIFITTFLSYLLTDVNNLQFVLYFRKLLLYILFFYALFNINITQIQKKKIIALLMILFIIQIPAALIKLFVLGGTLEKIVGTMSVTEGSLATIMPLFPIVYLISHYLEYKNNKDMFLVVLFIGIGLISNKLGILFYVIGLFALLSYLYARTRFFIPNFRLIKKLITSTFYALIIFSLFVSLNPRANPEHKVGGSIDIEYLQAFVEDYQTLDLKSGVEGDGRFDAPFVAFDRLYSAGITNILFGFGPGEIIQSSFLRYKNPLLEKYNIGYGGRLGVVWILMQVGLIGLLLFTYFHFYLLKEMFKLYKLDVLTKDENIILLTGIGFSLIFFIDFFSYSSEILHSPGIALTYYFTIYYIFSEYREREVSNV